MVDLGVVPYLNAVPLTGTLDGRARLVVDVPSRLARLLEAGEVDAALLPVYDALAGIGDGFLGEYGIVSRGTVTSVLLFLRVPLPDVRTLVLDPASRTSAGLARHLVTETAQGPLDVTVAAEPGPDPTTTDADAVLVIGDPAMAYAAVWSGETVDLGEEWARRTGLPLVYARWTARPGLPPLARSEIAALLDGAAAEGVARREELARAWAALRDEDPDVAARYVREHVHYRIGAREEAGLARYAEMVRPHRSTDVTEARHA